MLFHLQAVHFDSPLSPHPPAESAVAYICLYPYHLAIDCCFVVCPYLLLHPDVFSFPPLTLTGSQSVLTCELWLIARSAAAGFTAHNMIEVQRRERERRAISEKGMVSATAISGQRENTRHFFFEHNQRLQPTQVKRSEGIRGGFTAGSRHWLLLLSDPLCMLCALSVCVCCECMCVNLKSFLKFFPTLKSSTREELEKPLNFLSRLVSFFSHYTLSVCVYLPSPVQSVNSLYLLPAFLPLPAFRVAFTQCLLFLSFLSLSFFSPLSFSSSSSLDFTETSDFGRCAVSHATGNRFGRRG